MNGCWRITQVHIIAEFLYQQSLYISNIIKLISYFQLCIWSFILVKTTCPTFAVKLFPSQQNGGLRETTLFHSKNQQCRVLSKKRSLPIQKFNRNVLYPLNSLFIHLLGRYIGTVLMKLSKNSRAESDTSDCFQNHVGMISNQQHNDHTQMTLTS